VQYPVLVVGTAERHIQIFNLNNPTSPYKVFNFCPDDKNVLSFIADNDITFEVANSRRLVFYCFSE